MGYHAGAWEPERTIYADCPDLLRRYIKLSSAGYRLVYEVNNEIATVVVVAVGKRERNTVYKIAAKRI